MKKQLAITLTFFSLLACEKSTDRILISDQVSKTRYYDNEILNEPSQKIYGKWECLFSIGGMRGIKVDPEYDYLEVVKYGVYGRIINNRINELGKLIIKKQDDNETIIDFFPDDKYKTNNILITKIIRFQGNDTLILEDNCADCYRDYFKRIK